MDRKGYLKNVITLRIMKSYVICVMLLVASSESDLVKQGFKEINCLTSPGVFDLDRQTYGQEELLGEEPGSCRDPWKYLNHLLR